MDIFSKMKKKNNDDTLFLTFDTETIALPKMGKLRYQYYLNKALNILKNPFLILDNIDFIYETKFTDSLTMEELLYGYDQNKISKQGFGDEEFVTIDLENINECELQAIESSLENPTYQSPAIQTPEKVLVCAAAIYNPYLGHYQFKIKEFKTIEDLIACSILILYFTNKMLKIFSENTKKEIYCYAHNGGRFDFIFLLNMLFHINEDSAKLIVRNGKVMEIRVKQNNYSIRYRDSLNLLNYKLADLAKMFLNESKKDIMSRKYSIVEFFNKLKNKNFSSDFDEYLKNDCVYLYKILEIFNKSLIEQLGISIFEGLTISSISKKLYFKSYNGKPKFIKITLEDLVDTLNKNIDLKDKDKKNIINIPIVTSERTKNFIYPNPYEIDLKVREAFKGGRVEVFIPKNDFREGDVIVYDVNSLYPYACANYPMPFGKPLNIVFNEPIRVSTCQNIPAFLKATILYEPIKDFETPILCVKKGIENIYPYGFFTGWFYSTEIESAISAGYKILIHEAIFYEGNTYNLKNYMSTIYNKRQNFTKKSNDLSLSENDRNLYKIYSMIYKLLMNGLYGIMGIAPQIEQFEICDNNKVEKLKKLNSNLKIRKTNKQLNLVSYDTLYNNTKSEDKNYEYNLKVLKSAGHISAAITANARVYMFEEFLKNRAYKTVLYSDTDSIMIYKNSDDIDTKFKDPTMLGKLKQEKILQIFYSIAKKVWLGIEKTNEESKLTLKFRGFTKELLYNVFNIKTTTDNLLDFNPIIDFFSQALKEKTNKVFTISVPDRIKKNLSDLEVQYINTTASFDYSNVERS